MQTVTLFSGRRILAVAALLGSSFAAMQAQTTATPAASSSSSVNTLDLSVPKTATAEEATFSSSAPANEVAVAENKFDFVGAMNAMQYGGRRTGRPRYRGGNSNADGSNKYEFFAGVGFTQPVGNTYHYYSPSWSFQVGAGRNFNKNVGVNVEFNWDNLNVNGRTFGEQSYIFTGDQNPYDSGLDASAHVWSFSLNPIYNIAVREGLGAYLTAGVGYYHKVTNFTFPQEGEYCDPYGYYGCFEYTANSTFLGGSYTSNAVGFNGGIGLTYKFSRFSNERLYGEIRYVVTLNDQRQGITYQNADAAFAAGYSGSNFFPANSHRTTYLPVKFGIRF